MSKVLELQWKNGILIQLINAFVAALPPANKQNVLTQKYVSLFMQPFEAWAEYRRTGYPNTLLLPGQSAALNVATASGQNNLYIYFINC